MSQEILHSSLSRRDLLKGALKVAGGTAAALAMGRVSADALTPPKPEGRVTPYQRVWETNHGSQRNAPVTEIIDNPDGLAALWHDEFPNGDVPTPTIDFKKNYAFFIALGDEQLGQSHIDIDVRTVKGDTRKGGWIGVYSKLTADNDFEGTSAPAVLLTVQKGYGNDGRLLLPSISGALPYSVRQQEILQGQPQNSSSNTLTIAVGN